VVIGMRHWQLPRLEPVLPNYVTSLGLADTFPILGARPTVLSEGVRQVEAVWRPSMSFAPRE
jgi:hypothetical protein